MSSFTDFLLVWFRPENFWIILGSLLVYYLRMMKPVMEKTNKLIDAYLSDRKIRDDERKRHHDVTLEIRDELKQLNRKLNS